MPSFTVLTKDDLYDAVKDECEDNGYKLSFALRSGLKMFLLASHDERIVVDGKFKKYLKKSS